jgi:hypothetical protein
MRTTPTKSPALTSPEIRSGSVGPSIKPYLVISLAVLPLPDSRRRVELRAPRLKLHQGNSVHRTLPERVGDPQPAAREAPP